jgi:hypothetical protein
VRNFGVGAILIAAVLMTLPAGAQVRSQPGGVITTEPSPVPGGAPWLEGWAGFGFQNNWYGGYLGVVAALNETHNVWADGWVLRGEGIVGHYDYTNPTYQGSNKNGPNVGVLLSGGSFYLGYRRNVSGLGMVTGYVGVDVQDHDNPDPSAQTRGTAVGAKFLAEVYNRLTPTMDFYGMAFFSSAWANWFALGRPGFKMPTISGLELWIGPEGMLLGNGYGATTGSCTNSGFLGSCRWEEGRLGGFAHIVIPNQPYFGDWIISGGYRQPLLCCSGDGYYVNISMNFRFY